MNRYCSLFYLLLLIVSGLMPAKADEGSSPEVLKAAYEAEQANVVQPILDFQQRYIEELSKLAKAAQQAGKLEEMLAIEKEAAEFRNGPISNIAKYPAVAKLREIYDSNMAPIEAEARKGQVAAIEKYITGLSGLITQWTADGKIDEAVELNERRQALRLELASLQEGDAIAPVATLSPGATDLKFVSEVETIPALQGKAGRLRGYGTFTTGEELFPPEVADMNDFVKVYAYDRSWVAIREDGSALIKYIRPITLTVHLAEERSIEMISRGFDGWIMNRRNEFWRIAEPDRVFDAPRNASGIVGAHCAGLAFRASDGEFETGGSQFGPNKQTPPPEDFFKGVVGAGSGSNSMIAVNPDGTLRGWEIDLGQPLPLDEISGVIEIESGRDHSVIRKADGTVISFSIRSSGRGWVPAMETPDDLGGIPARIRAGGNGSAVQRTDGTWLSWGQNSAMNEAISSAGIAIDLDLFANSTSGYAIWIEPVD